MQTIPHFSFADFGHMEIGKKFDLFGTFVASSNLSLTQKNSGMQEMSLR